MPEALCRWHKIISPLSSSSFLYYMLLFYYVIMFCIYLFNCCWSQVVASVKINLTVVVTVIAVDGPNRSQSVQCIHTQGQKHHRVWPNDLRGRLALGLPMDHVNYFENLHFVYITGHNRSTNRTCFDIG